MKIYPSLISGDILNIETMINKLDLYCDGYHIDIMDDHFVPNLTFGPMFVDAIIIKTMLPIRLHLMVDNPEKWLGRIAVRQNDIFIFHYEAIKEKEINDFIKKTEEQDCKIGIAVNPKTQIEKIFPFLQNLDHVLIMSVEPGFSGQKFIDDVTKKISLLVKRREIQNLKFTIGMDGGINSKNIMKLAKINVDEVGVASAIFYKKDFVGALTSLQKLC